MPNLLAHYLIAKRLFIKESQTSNFSTSFLRGNFDFFALGAQGPDPLFFAGTLPFHGLHLISVSQLYGNKIHASDGKKYFELLVNCAYVMEDDRTRARFQAFIFGQLTHYFLDREAHPFILYESGFDENGKITGKYHYSHAHFEAKIDVALAQRYYLSFFTHPEEIIPSADDFLRIIDNEFPKVLTVLYPKHHIPKHLYSNGVKNMRRFIHHMNPGAKITAKNQQYVDKVGDIRAKLLGKSSLSAMHLPLHEENNAVLNESREIWRDPVTGESHNESFLELQNRAQDLVEACYQDILRNGFNFQTISHYLNGLNYYGCPHDSRWVNKREKDILSKENGARP